jgi:hypothetical protein
MVTKQRIVNPTKEATKQARKALKPPRQTAKTSERVINSKLSMQALQEVVADLCECGHFSSEHYTSESKDGRYKAANCAECECPRFKRAYQVTRLAGDGNDHKSKK